MTAPAVVTGAGVVCGLGASAPEALAAFRSAGEAACRVTCDFGARLTPNQRRRLDRLSQLLLTACLEAAEGVGWNRIEGDRAALVVGTGLGCMERTATYLRGIARAGLAFADAMSFPDSMDSAPAAHIAMTLGCRGPSLTVTQREITGEAALILADLLLRQGAADAVIVAAGDAPGAEVDSLLPRLGSRARAGEAAAALVLETRESAARRGARVLGSLLGHGQAGLVRAGTTLRLPPPDVLDQARSLAFSMAGFPPEQSAGMPTVEPEDVSTRIGWVLGDGVLRAVVALDRIAAGAGPAVMVSKGARGGAAAAVLFGPGG